ncbi:MAG: TAT-variant-translocated molybdopterin oxidoreductase, partial [Verrucomicrobiales bacterium]|nr:TAT-variant-translocated molybdopterin oxidoreductase [Verrucomicrobiales bacterium]
MKRIWHHPEEPEGEKHYWRSANELNDTPEFRDWLQREFPQGAAEMVDGEDAEVTRRNFMKLMGAATSLAGFGMAACRRPEAYLVPYSQSVEWIIPGKPLLYASAMPRLGGCSPLVVTTQEGRPTHVTGNRLHPGNGNGTDGFAQAS